MNIFLMATTENNIMKHEIILAKIRELIKFVDLESGCLFKVGTYSRLGAY